MLICPQECAVGCQDAGPRDRNHYPIIVWVNRKLLPEKTCPWENIRPHSRMFIKTTKFETMPAGFAEVFSHVFQGLSHDKHGHSIDWFDSITSTKRRSLTSDNRWPCRTAIPKYQHIWISWSNSSFHLLMGNRKKRLMISASMTRSKELKLKGLNLIPFLACF